IQGNALQSGAANVFSGFDGADTFNVNLAAGTSVPNAAGTTLVINGESQVGAAVGDRDRVNINANQAGDGVRAVGITYANAASGDVDVSGLGTATVIDINTVETFRYNGDVVGGVGNDIVTVTGTAANDDLTIAPQNLNNAWIYRGGSPFAGPPQVFANQ